MSVLDTFGAEDGGEGDIAAASASVGHWLVAVETTNPGVDRSRDMLSGID